MKTIVLDIMVGGRFYCQLRYKSYPFYRITQKELKEFAERERPSLKGKDYEIIQTEQKRFRR